MPSSAAVDNGGDVCWICQHCKAHDAGQRLHGVTADVDVQWLMCGHWLHVVCADECMHMMGLRSLMDIKCPHCNKTGNQLNDEAVSLEAVGSVGNQSRTARFAADMVIPDDDAGTGNGDDDNGAILDASAGAEAGRGAAAEEAAAEEEPAEEAFAEEAAAEEEPASAIPRASTTEHTTYEFMSEFPLSTAV